MPVWGFNRARLRVSLFDRDVSSVWSNGLVSKPCSNPSRSRPATVRCASVIVSFAATGRQIAEAFLQNRVGGEASSACRKWW